MTSLHAGGKFNTNSYKVSGGLNGVGASVVNALSENLELTICREGQKFQQFYKKGKPVSELHAIEKTDKTGTQVVFYPDKSIFEDTIFKPEILINRTRELAFLNKKLLLIF